MELPYCTLIPEAILLDNPCVTRDEFVRLLDDTHASIIKEYQKGEPWDANDNDSGENCFIVALVVLL